MLHLLTKNRVIKDGHGGKTPCALKCKYAFSLGIQREQESEAKKSSREENREKMGLFINYLTESAVECILNSEKLWK
jgi:hypothetical protein